LDKFIRNIIISILKDNKSLLRIPLRQRAKFEDWLKFELAHYLEQKGMRSVEVESKGSSWTGGRTDITFFQDEEPYSLELKTANTSWKIKGVNSGGRPITQNIQSIIKDAEKLDSKNGIVAFVLFPIPIGDMRWISYLDRISKKTDIKLSKENNCEVVNLNVDDKNKCSLVVCSFMSKRFQTWHA
jgi:hypothetical protein